MKTEKLGGWREIISAIEIYVTSFHEAHEEKETIAHTQLRNKAKQSGGYYNTGLLIIV
jgi:hypothetical protein